jgi:DNA-binding response OmpR family regulator
MLNSNYTILIADDEQEILDLLKKGLEEEAYQVKTTLNGQKALEVIEKHNIDLMLLDWMMPELTGLEVCKQVRSKGHKAPVLFLTAKDTVEDTIEGLKSGANDYIKKPFNFEELLARIETHLRIYHNIDDVLDLGPIRLNVSKYQVFYEDKEVHLTEKEFNFLKYLMRNKGQVCKRNDILETVWDIHFDYDSSVLDVYMNAIRKKLNLQRNEYIKTVRGVGFMAEDE